MTHFAIIRSPGFKQPNGMLGSHCARSTRYKNCSFHARCIVRVGTLDIEAVIQAFFQKDGLRNR